jgi:hypothetical protein
MAITDIVLSGKVRTDAGAGVADATVSLLEWDSDNDLAGPAESGATAQTNSAGTWSITETTITENYDVKIEKLGSLRYLAWSDEIALKGVDTASLKIRGAASADAPLYFFASAAGANADIWTVKAADGGAFTFESFISGSSVAHVTISPNATVANSTVAFAGSVSVATSLNPDAADGATIGTASLEWSDIYLADAAVINLGADQDVTLTHYADNGILLNSTRKIYFEDGSNYDQSIGSSGSGVTTLASVSGITLDSGADIILDAGEADIFLKDDGTLFGTLTNNSGELLIKSSSSGTTAATFTGANVVFAGTVDATTDFTVGTTVITDDQIVMTPSASDTVTIAGATHGILNVTTVDAAGTAADVNIDADGEIVIDAADAAGTIFKIAGTAQLSVIDGAILPTTDNDIDLGSGSYQFKDAHIHGTLEADAITIGGTNVVSGSLITTLSTITAGTWNGGTVAVGYGGTGASSLTDGGILLGSGTGAITAMSVLSDGQMIVGNGATDPVAESGATLRTSIGVGTGDSPQFTGLTLTGDLAVNGDDITSDGNLQITGSGTAELAGTTVTLDSAGDIALDATDDINVPSAVGLTFADDGQKIESNGTDFTIASGARLNLTPTSDVHIANGTGMVIGHTAQLAADTRTAEFQILGTGVDDSMMMIGHSTNDNVGPRIYFLKSRAGTIGGSAVKVEDDDLLGLIRCTADDGTNNLSYPAEIRFEVDGTTGTDDIPARISFGTSPDGSQFPTDRMKILNNGDIDLINNDLLNPGDNANSWKTAKLTVGNGHLEVTSTGSPRGLRLINSSTALAEGSMGTNDMWMYVKDDKLVFAYKDATDANEYYTYVDMGSGGEDPPVWHWSQTAPS